MSVPKLRFKEFCGEWEEKKLKNIVEINPRTEELPNEFVYIDLESVENGILKEKKIIQKENAPSRAKRNVKLNDILYQTVRPYQQNNLFFNFDDEFEYIASTGYAQLRSTKNNSKYIYYMLHTKKFLDKVLERCTGTSYPAINSNDLSEINVFYSPFLEEQKKVGDFLSSIDKKISIIEEKLNLFNEYKKGIMQKIFNQELRFKDENGNDYPEWKTVQLKDVLTERKERNVDNHYKEVFSVAKNEGIVNQIEHLGRSFASKDISNYRIVMPNDIVYTKSPLSEYPYGIVKQNLLNRIGVVSVLYGVFTPINKITGLFIHYYFLCPNILNNYLSPIINKGAKNTINISNDTFLNGSHIMLPTSLEEQEKIANFLSVIDTKVEKISDELENLKEFKKGLLQKMFI